MDTSEFTEQFDLERFKAGEYALTWFNQLVEYHSIVDDRFYVMCSGENCPGWCLVEDLPSWRMKPAVSKEYPWIPHDGGECPIPWAKAGEWSRRLRNGCTEIAVPYSTEDAIGWKDHGGIFDIVAWRLTDGWLPVLDGKCPKAIEGAKAGGWEWKSAGVKGYTALSPASEYSFSNIIAVRLIKPAEKPVPQIFCSEAQDPTNWNTKGFKLADIIAAHSLPTATKIYRDYFLDVEPLHDYSQREQKSPGDCLKRIRAQYHTPVYVGIDWSKDVAAYHRFRSSPRGKEALAQIGKSQEPQLTPLGEDAMLNLFSAALTAFESEIERKRNG